MTGKNMTYEEFKSTFPVGSKFKIMAGRRKEVVDFLDDEKLAVTKYRCNSSGSGYRYEVMGAEDIAFWSKHMEKLK